MDVELPFDQSDEARQSRAKEIAFDVFQRRATGLYLPDELVIAEHPSLMPELFHELLNVKRLADAVLIAERAGSLDGEIEPLADDELDAPLKEGLTAAFEAGDEVRPIIRGYQLVCQIGCGGQAVVYRAVQESTGRPVALKVMTGGALLDARRRSRFDRETTIMATLDHPHIVRIIDRGRTDAGAFFIAMELVGGTSIEEYAKACAATDAEHPRQLLRLLAKVARALHAAHEAGIVHRDIKPSNIRIDRHGEPRILDFGLAADLKDLERDITQTGQWLGSIPWWSPEQASNGTGAANEQSDVYSLGVVLYQSVCGRFPYEIQGPLKDVLERIVGSKPNPLSVTGAKTKLIRGIRAVTFKALSKKPEQRYATALAFALDLESLAEFGVLRQAAVTRKTLRAFFAAILLCGAAGLLYRQFKPAPAVEVGAELPHFVNSIGESLVRLRSGHFTMGSPLDEAGHLADEARREVDIANPFWMGTTEVTRKQYRAVMPAATFGSGDDSLPANGVSFDDARAFCRRLSEREGRTYRLPSEAEWEYACRGGAAASVPSNLSNLAWFAENAGGQLHPVRAKQPNNFGLYDMLGNVAEWAVQQPLGHEGNGNTAAVGDPTVPDLRGGSIASPRIRCRPACRISVVQDLSLAGFRIICDSINSAGDTSNK